MVLTFTTKITKDLTQNTMTTVPELATPTQAQSHNDNGDQYHKVPSLAYIGPEDYSTGSEFLVPIQTAIGKESPQSINPVDDKQSTPNTDVEEDSTDDRDNSNVDSKLLTLDGKSALSDSFDGSQSAGETVSIWTRVTILVIGVFTILYTH
ncbi:hypothetical protein HDU86_000568 [Geranomyces michiganensis]|nr:hypothetical protein HDU86_000568 [Geranomyces michiganensis]